MRNAAVDPNRQNVRCPICKAAGVESGTRVGYTRTSGDGARVARRRQCLRDGSHEFFTDEYVRAASLSDVFVRRSTDERLGERFSKARLHRDVRHATLGTLDDTDLNRVVEEAVASLADQLREEAVPLTSEEQAQVGGDSRAVSLWDFQIMEEVERRLHEIKTRVAYVVFALGVRGQVNLHRRPSEYAGFNDARDFLGWLFSEHNYPQLFRQIEMNQRRPTEMWWSPPTFRMPSHVLKANGVERPFVYDQFQRSIAIAMRGRPRSQSDSVQIAKWTLIHLEGQRRISTSQLSAGVTSALRRVDDVAYLRWATVAKGLDSVSAIADEAEDLIAYPSIGLRFSIHGQPRSDKGTTLGA